MTLPLQAYLLIRYRADVWSSTASANLEPVVSLWTSRSDPEQTSGVLHIGFEQLASELFEPLTALYPGRLLVTAAAKYALPAQFKSETTPVGTVAEVPVFLATTGWAALSARRASETPAHSQQPSQILSFGSANWLAAFLDQHPDLAPTLKGAGIVDDASYLANEAHLDRSIRRRVGMFRCYELIGERRDDPCAIVQEAPPWLLDRALDTIGLTVRISNVFKPMGFEHVRDLQTYTVGKLRSLPNFGRLSVADLRDALLNALNDGPFNVQIKLDEAKHGALLSQIKKSLEGLDERDRDVLVRRMGLGCEKQTLQQIGKAYDITRERVRQIELAVIKRLRTGAFWHELLVANLERLVAEREFPMPVQGLEAVDPWFEGVGRDTATFEYVLTTICSDQWSVLDIDGAEYVGKLTQDEWRSLVVKAQGMLAGGAEQRWTEEHCRTLVDTLLKEPVREFRPLLWKLATKHCHFVAGRDGTRALTSYGRGAEKIVEAVLQEADSPLHFTEIAKRASQRAGRPIDERRAHGAAGVVGLLLGRGTFGAEKHLALSNADAATIREEVEEIVFTGPDDRQWHASELSSLLAERDLPLQANFDKYVVDIVLKASTVLQGLGRMIWTKANVSTPGATERIEVRDTVVKILQKAGGPLQSSEIQQRLVALRGINQTILITDGAPLVRLGHGLWGLNDRDIPLNQDQQRMLVEQLVAALQSRGEGIHVSELSSVLNNSDYLACTPQALLSIATQDPQLTANVGKYLYLAAWGHARRENVIDALRATLEQARSPLTIDEVVARVETRLKRGIVRTSIYSRMQAIGAKYEPATQTWALPEANDTAEEEFIDADSVGAE